MPFGWIKEQAVLGASPHAVATDESLLAGQFARAAKARAAPALGACGAPGLTLPIGERPVCAPGPGGGGKDRAGVLLGGSARIFGHDIPASSLAAFPHVIDEGAHSTTLEAAIVHQFAVPLQLLRAEVRQAAFGSTFLPAAGWGWWYG